MTRKPADWLHGDLESDDEFRSRWAAYVGELLRAGMTTTDGLLVARRLQRIALENMGQRTVSINAGADLSMFGIALGQKAGQCKNAFHVRVPDDLDLNQITTAILTPEDRREMYLHVRRVAFAKLERCRSTEVDGWPALFGAWFDFIVTERILWRWWPAENAMNAERSEEVGQLFDKDQYRTLSKEDAELEEAFADIFTTIMFHATDEAQEHLHRELLAVDAHRGNLEARARLREMRQEFQVTPWNYAVWDRELRSGPQAGTSLASIEESSTESVCVPEPTADASSPAHIFVRWTEALESRDQAGLTALLDELIEWGESGSPIERALAFSEAATVIAQTDSGAAYGVALAAGAAIDTTWAERTEAERQQFLRGVLAPALNNVLSVLLNVSKTTGGYVDRAVYAWIRRLDESPDLPEAVCELTLMQLIAYYQNVDEAAAAWAYDGMGYDHRFLAFGNEGAAGWRFVFEPDGSGAMDPFELSSEDVATLRSPPGEPRTGSQRESLRRALFGPWVDLRLEVGLSFQGPLLIQRCKELSDLDLTWLGGAMDDEEPAWPTLTWFDRPEGH